MKAARFHGPKDIRVEEIAAPELKDGEVLVSIEWCGICGSDLHEYLIGPSVIPTRDQPHHVTGETLPLTMGHEFCGRLKRVPEGSKLKVEQAVMIDPRFYCTACYACQSLSTNLCTKWGFRGLSGGGGGYSEEIAVQQHMCHVLPDSVKLSDAALIEPLTVGRHAVKSSGFERYDDKTVLVIGGGPIGQALLYNLRARGARQVYVSEPTLKRHEQVEELADAVFNPVKVKVADKCRSLTAGKGVDIVFDCAGIMPGFKDGMDAVRRGGTVVNVAGWEKECIVPMEHFMLKEIVYRASMSYTDEDFREVVDDFIAGKFKGAEKMITDRISLDDVVAKGFEELVKKKDEHVKILVTPNRALLATA